VGWRKAQAIQHLPSKLEALSSNLSTTQKESNDFSIKCTTKGYLFKYNLTGHRWLTPVILATGETDQEDPGSTPARTKSS
jgi:hypothetical protein